MSSPLPSPVANGVPPVNIALPAFLLITLIMPGVILRSAYRTIGNTRISQVNFWEASFRTITLAALLHAPAVLFVDHLTPYSIHLDTLLYLLLSAKPQDVDQAHLVQLTLAHSSAVWCYFMGLFVVSFGLGKGLQWAVRRFRWDRYVQALRFPNMWFYLLTEAEDPSLNGPPQRKKPDGVCISAVVNQGTPMLYYGFLSDFEVEESELKRVVLHQACRRPLKADRTAAEPHIAGVFGDRGYEIQAEHLIIEASDISTLSIEYVWLEEELNNVQHLPRQPDIS